MGLWIRKGDQKDTEAFICLLQEVRTSMEHKEWFYLDPPEMIREMMADGTMELWLAVDGERIAAALDILRPGMKAFNYGHDLGLSDDELRSVINMDNAAVHPDYRGQKLQKRLLQCIEEQLQAEGNRILLCTVHPDNRFSLENVLDQGYTIQKKLEKYGSVRYILRKDI